MRSVALICLIVAVKSIDAQLEISTDSGSTLSISGLSSSMFETLLHPLKPFLGEEGHQAFHNALRSIPSRVLSKVTSLGQLFSVMQTFNPLGLSQIMSRFLPTSALSSLIPGLGGLSGLGGQSSNGSPLSSFMGRNFPASAGSGSGFNPTNFANGLFGQGMSNFAGVTSSLANGQPLNALMTMAGGAADTAHRFGNLAGSGFGMATQAASGIANRFPGSMGQMSNPFSSTGSSSSSSQTPSSSASASPSGASANSGASSGSSATSSAGTSGASASSGSGSMFSNFFSNPMSSFFSG